MLLEPAPPALFHWIKLIEILGGTRPAFPTLKWNYYNRGLTSSIVSSPTLPLTVDILEPCLNIKYCQL